MLMLDVDSGAQLCHRETALKLPFLSLVNFYSDSDIKYIKIWLKEKRRLSFYLLLFTTNKN